MSSRFWFVFVFVGVFLTACAQSTSVDDTPPRGERDAGSSGRVDDDEGDASIEPGGGGDGQDASLADADTETDGDALDEADPCEGKSCSEPPANVCVDAESLRVYEPTGVCKDDGECSYTSTVVSCPCAKGACIDDPCLGVHCGTPPEECVDETTVKVFEKAGTCNEDGECSYAWEPSFCHFGCVAGKCKDDPCETNPCNSPPAPRCSADGKSLIYYESSIGNCAPKGADDYECDYPSRKEQPCSGGCINGECKEDPCIGKACDTPPASECIGSVARTYTNGSCNANTGGCSYDYDDETCEFGCSNGRCKNCSEEGGCGVGEWCNANSCSPCNNDFHCGPSCLDCYALGGKKCQNGSCVDCINDTHCGPGKRCENNVCVDCDSAAACGTSCSPCSGATPYCQGGQCVCDSRSCGQGSICNGSSCSPCNTSVNCGPSCTSCSGERPVCGGTAVGCVCTESSCGAGRYCDTNGACADCGQATCGNGRCDCGETSATCPEDCGPPCPTGLMIGSFASDADGWSWTTNTGDSLRDFWWLRPGGFMGGGNGNLIKGKYTQDLTYGPSLDLRSCQAATLSFEAKLDDDEWRNSTDKSERLYIQCSGDGGSSWQNLTPNPWPSKQSQCGTSFCTGSGSEHGGGNARSFGWTAQNIVLPAQCRTQWTRIRFRAEGASPFNMKNPGWSLRGVRVN